MVLLMVSWKSPVVSNANDVRLFDNFTNLALAGSL
jgi:hypothetical protein